MELIRIKSCIPVLFKCSLESKRHRCRRPPHSAKVGYFDNFLSLLIVKRNLQIVGVETYVVGDLLSFLGVRSAPG